jgi:NAD(P)-dependent dehydrogenase (short-subunit alcohol dehydrogenase family)
MKKHMPAIKDRVVVVTGSTRGYGSAVAECLLEASAAVTVTGRTRPAVAVAPQDVGGILGLAASAEFAALILAPVIGGAWARLSCQASSRVHRRLT